jgi:hypothetical protein
VNNHSRVSHTSLEVVHLTTWDIIDSVIEEVSAPRMS